MFSTDSNTLLNLDSWMLVLSHLTYFPPMKSWYIWFLYYKMKIYSWIFNKLLTKACRCQHCMELTRHRLKITKLQRREKMTISVHVSEYCLGHQISHQTQGLSLFCLMVLNIPDMANTSTCTIFNKVLVDTKSCVLISNYKNPD